MKLPFFLLGSIALLLAGCPADFDADEVALPAGREPDAGAGAPPAPPAPPPPPPVVPPGDAPPAAEHPYFPLTPGSFWIYEGFEEGRRKSEEVRVLDERRSILGFACAEVEERVRLDGELVEVTIQWFALDANGALWWFGERSHAIVDGRPEATGDSWEAGRDGALPVMLLDGDPEAGESFPDAARRTVMTVLSTGAEARTPAGLFRDCLEVADTNLEEVEDEDRIIYAPGVGRVREENPDGSLELVSHGR